MTICCGAHRPTSPASPASVPGAASRRRPGIFAQIADGGFVIFAADAHAARERALHARGHRSVEPAPGIYRISVVVHLMSLPEQRFLEVY